MREYVRVKSVRSGEWYETDAMDTLARTVYENEELFDTGVLDEHGDKIMARELKNPIGYVWHR